MSNKFVKPPLTEKEKEKKAEDFLNFTNEKVKKDTSLESKKDEDRRILVKENTKRITMRLQLSLLEDIAEISAITGLSKNSVIMELLRNNVRYKLKELKDQD